MSDEYVANYAVATGTGHGFISMLPYRIESVIEKLNEHDTDLAKLELVQMMHDVTRVLNTLGELETRRSEINRQGIQEVLATLEKIKEERH